MWDPVTGPSLALERASHAFDGDDDDDDELARLCVEALTSFEQRLPELRKLPQTLIHSDLNEQNVLVDDRGAVCGVIDFGDATIGPRLCDVGVAAAYFLLDLPLQKQIMPSFFAFMRGVISASLLDAAELRLVWLCMRARPGAVARLERLVRTPATRERGVHFVVGCRRQGVARGNARDFARIGGV